MSLVSIQYIANTSSNQICDLSGWVKVYNAYWHAQILRPWNLKCDFRLLPKSFWLWNKELVGTMWNLKQDITSRDKKPVEKSRYLSNWGQKSCQFELERARFHKKNWS